MCFSPCRIMLVTLLFGRENAVHISVHKTCWFSGYKFGRWGREAPRRSNPLRALPARTSIPRLEPKGITAYFNEVRSLNYAPQPPFAILSQFYFLFYCIFLPYLPFPSRAKTFLFLSRAQCPQRRLWTNTIKKKKMRVFFFFWYFYHVECNIDDCDLLTAGWFNIKKLFWTILYVKGS